uniref:Uncharacterized protein n=1 Tax=Arundo donax TaxID=35708 RepID=A0A0A9C8H4_ARUDO
MFLINCYIKKKETNKQRKRRICF